MRKLIFKVHMYAGLCVGLLLAMSGLTGSMLVFGEEIDRLLNPTLLRVEPRAEERATLEDVLDSVKRSYPNEKAARLRFPHDPQGTYEICFEGKRDPRCAYVDPHSASVLGSRVPAHSFKGRLFSLHRRLISGETGETIIGIGGIMLLLMGLSGLFLWWPGRRSLSRGWTLKRNGSQYRTSYNLHRMLGICALPFLIVTASTGAAMVFRPSFEGALNRLDSARAMPAPKPMSVARAAGFERVSLDEIVRRADTALPQGETTMITLATTPQSAITVRKKLPTEWHPSGRSLVYLDQYSGEPLLVENSTQALIGTRAGSNLYPIHTGRYGGLTTRVLQALTGCVLAGLFVSGLLMFWGRRLAKRFQRFKAVSFSQ
ncbi:MAG TPA: PepSY domain-containing protein [Pyrinomonadaceae bacterium]|jgi:uncharacterized iron-regulated membrane protein